MNALLEQFLSESRDFLQGIAEKLMQLEENPNSPELMVELFRFVHTLKGNSGLFDFPEMTRVLHASEDLMDAVRNGRVGYSQELADQLLEAMDFVGMLMDEIESTGELSNQYSDISATLAKSLRALIVPGSENHIEIGSDAISILLESSEIVTPTSDSAPEKFILNLPEDIAIELYKTAKSGEVITFLEYTPEAECFFKGEDPFFLVQQIPTVLWRDVVTLNNVPLAEMDAYSCQLIFRIITTTDVLELRELFRYVLEQVNFEALDATFFILPNGEKEDDILHDEFVANALALLNKNDTSALIRSTETMLGLVSPTLWFSSALRWLLVVLEFETENRALQRALIESLRTFELSDLTNLTTEIVIDHVPVEEIIEKPTPILSEKEQARFDIIFESQRDVLNLPNNNNAIFIGRLKAVVMTLKGCCLALNKNRQAIKLEKALEKAIAENSSTALLAWLDDYTKSTDITVEIVEPQIESVIVEPEKVLEKPMTEKAETPDFMPVLQNRRAEDNAPASKTLKVDQEKIDRLMNLIGEMVVAKNALPYLANRAETVFGVRELSREIKAQYAVINRVAEEMQDTIMQVRMMPVSFVFQRFPRMVRDISRKLGKEVQLVLEGETTEADKNIIEALADPLIHIVRNSLDHGLESPEVRKAAGKSAEGKLLIRASQESDRVLIEIIDDGKGIDPNVIKNKAYEKGLIDESTLERISNQDAVNLVFAAGFSTADVISDLSGRGVGMDVVRSAVEKVNGTVGIESEVGKGTRLFLSLPLSMAVTNVMIIESNKQIFGVPMDMVVETVRVAFDQIRTIKQKQTTVLRGRIVPLLSLNELLAQNVEHIPNEDNEFATLIVRIHGENVGILVDDFRETVDIILKPMTGILGGLSGYSGAALLGDGSVLMVLNPRELI